MTLVYAKIIGMFVCGAEPGGRGWGGGGWGGWVFFYEISSEINCTHIYLSDMLGGHPYICHDITHAHFYQKLDLDPHNDPYILTICGPSETMKFVFFINFRDYYQSDSFVS